MPYIHIAFSDSNIGIHGPLAFKESNVFTLLDSNVGVETLSVDDIGQPIFDSNVGVEKLCVRTTRKRTITDSNVGHELVGRIVDDPRNAINPPSLSGSFTPLPTIKDISLTESSKIKCTIQIKKNGVLIVPSHCL